MSLESITNKESLEEHGARRVRCRHIDAANPGLADLSPILPSYTHYNHTRALETYPRLIPVNLK